MSTGPCVTSVQKEQLLAVTVSIDWVQVRSLHNECTAWCSEIGSLRSLDAPELHAYSDVREPISLHQAVQKEQLLAVTVSIDWVQVRVIVQRVYRKSNWQSNNLNWRGIAFPGALDVVNVASVMAMALAFVASVLPLEKDVLTASRSKGIDAGTLPMQTNLLFPFLPTLKSCWRLNIRTQSGEPITVI